MIVSVSMASKEDTDSITQQLNDLRVTDAEKACVYHLREGTIDETRHKLENAILCKIFTNKKINPDMFCSKMPKIWSQEQTVIACVGFNLFLCKFRNARVKSKIIEDGPWFFDKALLLMEDPKGDSCGDETDSGMFLFGFIFINSLLLVLLGTWQRRLAAYSKRWNKSIWKKEKSNTGVVLYA